MPYHLPLIIVSLILLAGCVSAPQVAQYNTNIDHKYPPISVFYAAPSKQLKDECSRFDHASILQSCQARNLPPFASVQALEESQLFEKVDFANKEQPFKLAIAAVNLHTEKAAGLLNAALSGASLMLLPLQEAHEIKLEATLYFYDRMIKQYTYQLPYIRTHSLFNSANNAEPDFAQLWVSHFITDLQQDTLFSPQTMAAALQSTDYSQNLSVPQLLGDFVLQRQVSYYNPLLGHQTRYAHPDFSDDHIDLFVYPIRQIDTSQSNDKFNNEIEAIQQDISMIAEKEQWQDLSFSELDPVSYTKEGERFQGVSFDIEYTNSLGEQKFSGLYLFQLQDKWLKWRLSFPSKLIKQAVLSQMQDISVPQESVFMATLRQQWRQQALGSTKS